MAQNGYYSKENENLFCQFENLQREIDIYNDLV